jgi:hypothetical protein
MDHDPSRARHDLNGLATLFATDKWGSHWYTQHYERFFSPLRLQRLNILEIGVGGYDNTAQGGESLRMWAAYFPRSLIYGIDVYDKTRFSQGRIRIRQCSQTDAEGLRRLCDETGGFDIVIDDGSHMNKDVTAAFEILFPGLRRGGMYAIEDVQTAYWPSWDGGLSNPASSMAFFKKLAGRLSEDSPIAGITFFHNLVLLRKKSVPS